MIKATTNRDIQRITFIESLYSNLKKQAKQALKDQQKFIILAENYLKDGLEESECIELLMIDGLSRDASEGYVSMIKSGSANLDDNTDEYSFQFEDEDGKLCSSYDIGKTVMASSENEAWKKSEEVLNSEYSYSSKVLSVHKIS
jgi:hypothetical protein